MSEFIMAEKLWRFRLCWQQPVVKAVHMVVDQEAKSSAGTRACYDLQRPVPTDLFPPPRLHLRKVPQSPRTIPLAEEQVSEMSPGM